MRIASLMTALVLTAVASADEQFTTDKLDTVKKNIEEKKAVLIDVREQREWDAGHVAGAIFLPLSELARAAKAKEMTKDLDKSVILYTHCARGKRAQTAAGVLKNLGFEVRPLQPGYAELIEAGFDKGK